MALLLVPRICCLGTRLARPIANNYCSVPSKCPRVLGIHRLKLGVGAYTEKPFCTYNVIHANSMIIKMEGGCLHVSLGHYGMSILVDQELINALDLLTLISGIP